ncbi:MAG: hypothetical protein IT560_09180 [Alphaproteobacteria bacterium]|nr:hypothetical protein [Alphaproteobacteria bacterium]
MEEEFNKVGAATLRVDFRRYEGNFDGLRKYDGYTKLFNFLSREVTTTHREWLGQSRGSDAAGVSALSSHTQMQSFDDLSSTAEVAAMHAKLVELGGTPPGLDEVLPAQLNKKPAGLRSNP